MTITREWIHQHATKGKGWTHAQLNILDVAWPPTKGWLSALIGREISEEVRIAFEDAAIQRRQPGPAFTPKQEKQGKTRKKWKAVLNSIPLRLRQQYAYGLHMHERPNGMSREQWISVWVDQHAAKWPIADRFAVGKLPLPTVNHVSLLYNPPRLSPRVKQKTKPKNLVVAEGFLQSYEWRQLRMRVITRRGARCECCGASPGDGVTIINVDHIKPRRLFPELALVESNLQVLCNACNHGKGNWDQTDWRRQAPSAEPIELPVNWNDPIWNKPN